MRRRVYNDRRRLKVKIYLFKIKVLYFYSIEALKIS